MDLKQILARLAAVEAVVRNPPTPTRIVPYVYDVDADYDITPSEAQLCHVVNVTGSVTATVLDGLALYMPVHNIGTGTLTIQDEALNVLATLAREEATTVVAGTGAVPTIATRPPP